MITVKKKQSVFKNKRFIEQYSNVVRYSYNRIIKDGILKASELEKKVKTSMNNIELLDASWIKAAVKKSLELHREEKVYFGGKKQFFDRKYNKIQSYSKDIPVDMRGETGRGNRKAELDLLNNQVIFKPKCGVKYYIPLKLSKNEKDNLYQIQLLCEKGEGYFNFKISEENVWISFEETLISKKTPLYKEDRILGIDVNPNYIGICIMDINSTQTEVYKEILDLRELNKRNDKNKKEYEIVTISKHIIKLVKHYKVEIVSFEKLNMKGKNHGKGKYLNVLLNQWNRRKQINNLKKYLNLNSIKYYEVRAEYSSFIGQMIYEDDYDMVAASKEIAFRSYLLKNNLNEYDSIDRECMNYIPTRWKEMVYEGQIFKQLYYLFKKKKLLDSYRFLYNDKSSKINCCSSFSLISYKSLIKFITY